MTDEDAARLRAEQEALAAEEAQLADHEDDPDAEHAHERRSEKAAYLAEKLAERESSEA